MSQMGQTRTFQPRWRMSAIPPIAEVRRALAMSDKCQRRAFPAAPGRMPGRQRVPKQRGGADLSLLGRARLAAGAPRPRASRSALPRAALDRALQPLRRIAP